MGSNGVTGYLRGDGDFDHQQILGGVGNAKFAERVGNLGFLDY